VTNNSYAKNERKKFLRNFVNAIIDYCSTQDILSMDDGSQLIVLQASGMPLKRFIGFVT
jgi:hypothetical protein